MVSLVGGRNCLRPDGSLQMGVLQLLSWDRTMAVKVWCLHLTEWKSSQGAGDIKGSQSLRVRLAPCPLLNLWSQNQLNENSGITPPIIVVTVGA
jgi:hypothetical protein